MKKIVVTLAFTALALIASSAGITLEYCLEKAEANYPLIKKYGLVDKTGELSLSDINKSWLPRVGVYGQATVQNTVPEFPQSLTDVLAQLGQEPRGLGHVQYKVGADVTQTVWDGCASKARRAVERATTEQRRAAISVEMYAVREKVMDLYFGILLTEAQMAQTENTLALLEASHAMMQKMEEGGIAMQSDVDMIEAQTLTMKQQLTGARSAAKAYRDVLSVYVGESVAGEELRLPEASLPSDPSPARPELGLFDARIRLNTVRNEDVESSVMPKVGLFAQAYYGYPGFNYFESMMKRDLSFNLIAGLKVSWNIDSFYTKRNSQKKLAIANEEIENDREVFLFNTGLQTKAQTEEIEGLRRVMAEDGRIVALRKNVRTAAESQLENGIIDATALLDKITDENQARLTACYHEIQFIQKIYKLKNILNR